MKLKENLIKLCPPQWLLPVKYQYSRFSNKLEKEIMYLPELIGNGKRAIDIGANDGLYSYALSKICEVVEAFEPQPWLSETIMAYNQAYRGNINFHGIACSNLNGSLSLHLPVRTDNYSRAIPGLGRVVTGLASFRELDEEQISIEVPVRKLDDYCFNDVSLIKIDVEGHEIQVIEGSRNTILKEKPIMIVEIEQRHLGDRLIDEVLTEIIALGYEGYFLYRNNLHPLSEFSYEKNQQPFLNDVFNQDYINNFIFKPI